MVCEASMECSHCESQGDYARNCRVEDVCAMSRLGDCELVRYVSFSTPSIDQHCGIEGTDSPFQTTMKKAAADAAAGFLGGVV